MSARNEVTGKAYAGGNILRLEAAEIAEGYDETHGWAGFGQWKSVGRVVRKGERGVACLTVTHTVLEDGSSKRGARGFRVFHYDQTTELVPAEDAPLPAVVPPSDEAMRQAARDHAELVRAATARSEREHFETIRETTVTAIPSRRFGIVRDPGEDMADRWAETHS